MISEIPDPHDDWLIISSKKFFKSRKKAYLWSFPSPKMGISFLEWLILGAA